MTDLEPVRADEPSAGETDATVLLLLDHDRNRRILGRTLAEEYAVVDGTPGGVEGATFDVCIVDARSFERHREALADEKRRAEPAFLPYVFLTDEDREGPLPDAVWDLVDEVLTMPLSPTELTHRLENLVQRRRLSVDLERRKERTERRFETLFDTVPDPIVVTSSDGVIAEVNESFAATIDEDPADLVGRSITDLGVSPANTVERVLLRVVEPETVDPGDPAAVRLEPDGNEPMITELNADVVSALGEATERIGIFRDVTERAEREAELRQQNERLQEFASVIAHDLRNPLSIAQARLDLARDRDEPEHLDVVARAHDRMEQLIDEILALARQGKAVMDPEPVSLRDAATRAWKNVETGEATLSVETDEAVLADEGRFSECFENLFRNSVEHGSTESRAKPGDSVEHGSTGSRTESDDSVEHGATDSQAGDDAVAVRVGSFDRDGERGFFVADDGPGIPEADRAEVFEAGYTTTDGGTGFGLSIVRQIANGHDWEVTVAESDAGGARFEFVTADGA